MATQYFVRRGEHVAGPVDDGRLRDLVAKGKVVVTDQVADTRDGPWHVVGQVPAIASLFPEPPPPIPDVLQRNVFSIQRLASFSRWSRRFRSYDVLDPESKQVILQCRDQISLAAKLQWRLRLSGWNEMPIDIAISEPGGQQVMCLRQEGSASLTRIGKHFERIANPDRGFRDDYATQVFDNNDEIVGTLSHGMDAIRGADGQVVCHLESELERLEEEMASPVGITVGPIIIGLFPPSFRIGGGDTRGGWEFRIMSTGKPLVIDNVELPVPGNKLLARITKRWHATEIVTGADHYDLRIEDTVLANSPIRPLLVATALYVDLVARARIDSSDDEDEYEDDDD